MIKKERKKKRGGGGVSVCVCLRESERESLNALSSTTVMKKASHRS